jgi:hypothetical protein
MIAVVRVLGLLFLVIAFICDGVAVYRRYRRHSGFQVALRQPSRQFPARLLTSRPGLTGTFK